MDDVAFFDRIAPIYDWIRPSIDADAMAGWLAHADRPIERLIDVGGGPGNGADVANVAERIVVDPAPSMLERAEKRGLPTKRGYAEDLPFEDESADAALFVYSLHHVEDPEQALAEAARVLRPGGVVAVREVQTGRFLRRLRFHGGRRGHWFQEPDGVASKLSGAGFEPTVADRGYRFTTIGVRTD